MKKEPVNLYRVLSIVALILVTYSFSCLLCLNDRLTLDEWICNLTISTIFLLILIFELEFERLKGGLAYNTQSNFARIAVMFFVSAVVSYGMLYLPDYCRPVMVVVILMNAVSNPTVALLIGLYFDILLGISNAGYQVLVCMCILTLFGAVLSEGLKEKRFRIWIAFLMLFVNLMIPCIFYYLSFKELEQTLAPYWILSAAVTAVAAIVVFGILWKETKHEVENLFLDVISEDFSEVKALKDFSMYEYEHAKRVADVAYRCAKSVGLNENLCMAGGFYYRMSRWLGEPYHKNVWDKSRALCFPENLIQILLEYYGEEQQISSPESALVHMVDALMIKMDRMKNEMGASQWNRDILIYQTVNEYSSNGLYDHSGMSMNLFLKVREFLAKEEALS